MLSLNKSASKIKLNELLITTLKLNVTPVQILEDMNIIIGNHVKKITNKLKTVHISLSIYISFICLYLYTFMLVLFAWLFPYKGPEICQLFCRVSFFNDMMSLRCCLAPARYLI